MVILKKGPPGRPRKPGNLGSDGNDGAPCEPGNEGQKGGNRGEGDISREDFKKYKEILLQIIQTITQQKVLPCTKI